MSNLLKTELYKLFHSWYFWGIGIFNQLVEKKLKKDYGVISNITA